jgi:hypothetical protein
MLTSEPLSRLSDSIRRLVIFRPDLLLYFPGRATWGIMVMRGDFGLLNLSGCIRISCQLDPSTGPSESTTVDPGRLMRALYGIGLPIIDGTGRELHTVSCESSANDNICCYIATSRLPWIDHGSRIIQNPSPDHIRLPGCQVDNSLRPDWLDLTTSIDGKSQVYESAHDWIQHANPIVTSLIRKHSLPPVDAISVAISFEIQRAKISGNRIPEWAPQRTSDLRTWSMEIYNQWPDDYLADGTHRGKILLGCD